MKPSARPTVTVPVDLNNRTSDGLVKVSIKRVPKGRCGTRVTLHDRMEDTHTQGMVVRISDGIAYLAEAEGKG